MNRSPFFVGILGTGLVTVIGLLVFACIDTSISLDHARQEEAHLQLREQLLRSLVLRTASRMPKEELIRILENELNGTHIIKKDNNLIEIDDIVLEFKGNRLTAVHSLSTIH